VRRVGVRRNFYTGQEGRKKRKPKSVSWKDASLPFFFFLSFLGERCVPLSSRSNLKAFFFFCCFPALSVCLCETGSERKEMWRDGEWSSGTLHTRCWTETKEKENDARRSARCSVQRYVSGLYYTRYRVSLFLFFFILRCRAIRVRFHFRHLSSFLFLFFFSLLVRRHAGEPPLREMR
jgi:hypothetical protein